MLVHLAHANGIPGAAYQPILERLKPHQGLAIPRLGHNPLYSRLDNWRELSDELIAYLQANTTEPVLGVGHSMGSIVTFMAACKCPDLFRGVLMLDPPLFWGWMALGSKVLKRIGKMDNLTPAGKSKFRRRQWADRKTAVDYFASKKLFQFHPDCFSAFCNAAIEDSENGEVKLFFDVAVEVEIFRNTPDNLRSFKRPPQLPIRLVYADRSDATMEKMVIPFCRHFSIPYDKISGEHMYPLQQPDLAAELIHQFIRECE